MSCSAIAYIKISTLLNRISTFSADKLVKFKLHKIKYTDYVQCKRPLAPRG